MMLAADNWCVKADDKVYGPYTSAQLRKFVHEGRLAPWSLIAPAGSQSWREAGDDSTFAGFFGLEVKTAKAQRAFGRRDAPTDPSKEKKKSDAASATVESAASTPCNFLIVFDVVNAAASRVEAAVLSLGPAFRIADNVWAVTCELTAIGVRNSIAPYLLPRESIFVVDTTRGRSSWQNYSPEIHAKISAAWTGAKAGLNAGLIAAE